MAKINDSGSDSQTFNQHWLLGRVGLSYLLVSFMTLLAAIYMHNSMTSQTIVTKVNSLPNHETLQSTLISQVVIKSELFNFNAHTTSVFGFACFDQRLHFLFIIN